MSDLQNQIIALRRQMSLIENNRIVFDSEPNNPGPQTIWVDSQTRETKYWDGRNWIITGGALTDWNTSAAFSATDYRTIEWSAGVVSVGTTTSKTDYATTPGNFTMTQTTYFYWQSDSPTSIQTSIVAGDVVISGGILMAVGRLNPDTANKASLKAFGGPSVDQIIADEIVANSVTSNMLQANSITSSKLATSLLYAGELVIDTDGAIMGGQTAYNTGTGFFMGWDPSGGGSFKFSIGNPAGNYIYWDGEHLVLNGSTTLSGTLPWSSVTNDGNAPANNATVGAAWGTNLTGIPTTLTTPSGNGLYLSPTYMGYYSGGAFSSYVRNNGDFYFKGDAGSSIDWNVTAPSTLTVRGKIQTGTGSVLNAGYLSGTVAQTNLNVANRGWGQTCVFSVTDADTVSWGSGTFTSADGTSYSISAGNTGNMAAKTYVYLDIGVSATAYQVTTSSATAVGAGKIMVAVAQNGAGEATYLVMAGQGGMNVNASDIVAASITANEIALLGITSAVIASGAVTTAKIASLAVTSAEISANAVTTAKIASDAVTSAQIAAGAVGSNEISAGAVIAGKIAAGTITASDIASGTITAGQIAANTITASQIAASTITATQIASNTITAGQIAALTLTASEIAAGTITGAKIAAGTITASNITAGTITASQIAAGTITATQIAAGTITAANIVSGTITANQIAAGTITAGNISTLNMTGKSCTFDTGTVGGWTLGATTLTATNSGNTTTLSSGSTAFSAGPTGSPTITITQDGALTATSATIIGSITTGTGSSLNGGYVINGTLTVEKLNFTPVVPGTGSNSVNSSGYVTSIDGSSITVQNINASNITTGTITGITVKTAVNELDGVYSCMSASSSGFYVNQTGIGNMIDVTAIDDGGGYRGMIKFYDGGTYVGRMGGVNGSLVGIYVEADMEIGYGNDFSVVSGTLSANGKFKLPVGTNLY